MWALCELFGAMLFTAGGLALLQSAYPQRLRQFMLIMMQPAKDETDLGSKYLYGAQLGRLLNGRLYGAPPPPPRVPSLLFLCHPSHVPHGLQKGPHFRPPARRHVGRAGQRPVGYGGRSVAGGRLVPLHR